MKYKMQLWSEGCKLIIETPEGKVTLEGLEIKELLQRLPIAFPYGFFIN